METGFIEHVLSLIDTGASTIVSSAYAEISAQVLPIFRIMAVLAVALVGLNLVIQAVPLSVENGIRLMVRLGLVSMFLSSWANFDAVYGVFTNAPSEFGAAILASLGIEGAQNGLYAGLDRLYQGSIEAGNAVAQNGSYIAGAITSVVVFIIAVLFSVICVVVIGMAKIVLAVMIVFAPAAILCTMFKQSAGVFEGWVRVSLQAALVPLMMAAAAGVVIAISQEVAPTDLSRVETIGDLLEFLFVMILGTMVVARVPAISESLAQANMGLDRIAGSLNHSAVSYGGSIAKTTASKTMRAVSPAVQTAGGPASTANKGWQTAVRLANRSAMRKAS